MSDDEATLGPSPGVRLLLVDDDYLSLQVLGRFVSRLGYQFATARDGLEAVEGLKRGEFAIVITDLMMPRLDGMELIGYVKAHCPRTDVIVMTGNHENNSYIEVIKAGATDFIEKPIQFDELTAKLNRVFREQRLIGKLTQEVADRQQAEEEVQRNYQVQTILNNLFRLFQNSTLLTDTLERFLDYLLTLPLLDLEERGAVFLVEGEPGVLVMKAEKGLAAPLLARCGRLPFGRCLCGRAAATGQVVFTDGLGNAHEHPYEGSDDHGHYCVPIHSSSQELLGVFTLFTKPGRPRESRAEEILVAAARVLAGTINRLQAEEALRREKDFSTTLVQSSPAFFVAIDRTGRTMLMNEAMLAALNYTEAEVIGRDYLETFVPERNRSSLQAVFTELQQGGTVVTENQVVTRDGRELPVEWRVRPVLGPGGGCEYLIGLGIDITKRRQAEEALRESENKYRELVENANSIILKLDIEGRITFFNEYAQRFFGYNEAEILGRNVVGTIIPKSKSSGPDLATLIRKIGQEAERFRFTESENVTSQGQRVWVGWTNKAIYDRQGALSGILAVGQDMTAQHKLIEADKMISLGILVAGVAHEINNPNNFIMLNAPILERSWRDILPLLDRHYREEGEYLVAGIPFSEMRDNVPELFSGIMEGAERIKQIVLNLKDYAREDSSDMAQKVQVNEVLKAALTLLANPLKKATHHLLLAPAQELPWVRGNFQRIEQVLINVIQNASQSLSDSSQGITIATEYRPDPREVVVTVTDQGVGIAPGDLKRIMDPFFTTKRDRGGTGLGLSISTGIMQEHGGRLEFSSAVGRGTTVRIVFPTSRA